ncbi:MAG: hypothetical protein AAFZ99_02320 [Pseudomonadota bacterium]
MSKKIFDIQATPNLMPEIIELAKQHNLTAAEPMALDSSSDALDAPLGVDEVRQVLEVVTLMATTGTTVVGFLAAVKALMAKSEEEDGSEPKAKVVDTATQRHLGDISAETDVRNLQV